VENNRIANSIDISVWQMVLAALSILILISTAAESILTLPRETEELLHHFDNGICLLFLTDFAYRFLRAENRLGFMKWGWIDLLSSIPNLDVFRWGRLMSVIRVLRLLRAVRSIRVIGQVFFAKKAKSTLALVALFAIVLIGFSSILILEFESGPNGNIKSASDALWWSFTTITTVGYGDHYPVATAGRLVGAVLMTFGIALFGVFTAAVAGLLFGGPQTQRSEIAALAAEVQKLGEAIAEKSKQSSDRSPDK
jgi:voltage-gated potassium channel